MTLLFVALLALGGFVVAARMHFLGRQEPEPTDLWAESRRIAIAVVAEYNSRVGIQRLDTDASASFKEAYEGYLALGTETRPSTRAAERLQYLTAKLLRERWEVLSEEAPMNEVTDIFSKKRSA